MAKYKQKHEQVSYVKRDEILLSMGYPSYKAYLSSSVWRDFRDNFLIQNKKCYGCFGPSELIHHANYDENTLKLVSHKHLIPICHSCHTHIEFVDGRKIDGRQANKRLHKLREKNSGRSNQSNKLIKIKPSKPKKKKKDKKNKQKKIKPLWQIEHEKAQSHQKELRKAKEKKEEEERQIRAKALAEKHSKPKMDKQKKKKVKRDNFIILPINPVSMPENTHFSPTNDNWKLFLDSRKNKVKQKSI